MDSKVNNKQKKLQITSLILLIIAVIFLCVAGGVYYHNNHHIRGADSTMKLDASGYKDLEKRYGSTITNIVKQGWTGHNNDLVVKINNNKLTSKEIKIADDLNIAAPFAYQINKYNNLTAIQNVYGHNTYLKNNKVIDPNNSDKTANTNVGQVQSINSGSNNIIMGVNLINPHYLLQEQANANYNVTLMTEETASLYHNNEKNIFDELKDKNIQGVWYYVVPVYLHANDVVPVGYHIMGLGYKSLPNLEVKNGKIVHENQKSNYEFNYYLKNAQANYTINYHTGKVKSLR